MISLFSLALGFHILVLLRIIPYEMVWGGRISTLSEMYIFETISILINLLFLFVILIRAGMLKIKASRKLINISLWFMALLFLLNTAGNLVSKNPMERLIFTPLTLIISTLCFMLIFLGEKE